MSNHVTRTILNNGSKTLLLHVYLESNGSDGELSNYVIADPELYDSVFTDKIIQPNMKLTLTQAWYSFNWFDSVISFDDLNPVPCWLFPQASHNYIDFRYFGGLANRLINPDTATSTDRTGKILLSTNGFAPAGSVGTMVLEIRKSLD